MAEVEPMLALQDNRRAGYSATVAGQNLDETDLKAIEVQMHGVLETLARNLMEQVLRDLVASSTRRPMAHLRKMEERMNEILGRATIHGR